MQKGKDRDGNITYMLCKEIHAEKYNHLHEDEVKARLGVGQGPTGHSYTPYLSLPSLQVKMLAPWHLGTHGDQTPPVGHRLFFHRESFFRPF